LVLIVGYSLTSPARSCDRFAAQRLFFSRDFCWYAYSIFRPVFVAGPVGGFCLLSRWWRGISRSRVFLVQQLIAQARSISYSACLCGAGAKSCCRSACSLRDFVLWSTSISGSVFAPVPVRLRAPSLPLEASRVLFSCSWIWFPPVSVLLCCEFSCSAAISAISVTFLGLLVFLLALPLSQVCDRSSVQDLNPFWKKESFLDIVLLRNIYC
jgi:hypothetical protein